MSTVNDNNIIDIKFEGLQRKRYRINGDDSKIIALNPTDFNITVRMNEAYPKLIECETKVKALGSNKKDITSTETLDEFATALKEIDMEMRDQIDFIFDADVSSVCCDGGSMYDVINGFMRYEIILDTLTSLYEKNLNSEMKKVQRRAKTHTAKYKK